MIKTVSQLKKDDIVLLLSDDRHYNQKQCFVHKVGRKYIQVKIFREQNRNFTFFDIDTLRIKEGGFPQDCELFLGTLYDYEQALKKSMKRRLIREKIHQICSELPLESLEDVLNFCQSKDVVLNSQKIKEL